MAMGRMIAVCVDWCDRYLCNHRIAWYWRQKVRSLFTKTTLNADECWVSDYGFNLQERSDRIRQYQDAFYFAIAKLNYSVKIISQYLNNLRRWTIPNAKVDKFGRMTVEQTTLMKIRILGNNHEIIRMSIFPNH